MVEWLHNALREAKEKLKTRLNQAGSKLPGCDSLKFLATQLNFRTTPSQMRKKRNSELHVAQIEKRKYK
jgi:hypothetical protein